MARQKAKPVLHEVKSFAHSVTFRKSGVHTRDEFAVNLQRTLDPDAFHQEIPVAQ
jgi:hypothetical protein